MLRGHSKPSLVCDYVGRLLAHMDKRKISYATPRVKKGELQTRPLFDLQSGYVRRALDQMPLQGDREPWQLHQNYILDNLQLRFAPLRDRELEFGRIRPEVRHAFNDAVKADYMARAA